MVLIFNFYRLSPGMEGDRENRKGHKDIVARRVGGRLVAGARQIRPCGDRKMMMEPSAHAGQTGNIADDFPALAVHTADGGISRSAIGK